MMYFTRSFHYLRNPYLQNDHYPQFHYTRIKSPQRAYEVIMFLWSFKVIDFIRIESPYETFNTF